MDFLELLKLSGTLLGSLFSGSVVVIAFSSWLGKIWASRLMAAESAKHEADLSSLRNKLTQETESYKIRLRKSELIFIKEFEAATEFVSLLREISSRHSRPNMDHYESCDEIVKSFDSIGRTLKFFISKHGAVLQKGAKELIFDCIYIVTEMNQVIATPEITSEENQAANDVYEKLHQIEQFLLDQVHSQSSI